MLMSLETRITGRLGTSAEVHDHADDLVVGLGGRQRTGQDAVDGFGLQEQTAGGQFARRAGQFDAVRHVVLGAGDDFVEQAAGSARVAGDFGHALLVGVEFLQRHHRHVDVVFLEAEEAQSGRASAHWCRARTAW
jgi:hypothetical protein